MAYLGKGLNDIATANIVVDTMTGNGSDTTLALSWGAGSKGIGSVNDVSVFYGGCQQRPGQDFTLANGTVTFTTAPMNGVNVVAVSHGDSWQDNVADSTVVTESFADLAITNAKIIGLDSSKLSGAMPAIDGSALTGITETTNSASDPAIDTNGTLGDIWVNTASGEMFILTDATTDENVWTNIGAGTGDVQPWVFQGTIKGFSMGCESGASELDTIEHYSYSSDGDATDAADLTFGVEGGAGGKSETHAYYLGGKNGSNTVINTIQKFAFASVANSTNVATLKEQRKECAGVSSQTHIFVTGGAASQVGSSALADDIQKIATASDANGVRTGDLSNNHTQGTAHTSETHGHAVGGYTTASSGAVSDVIERYSLSSDENASDVGNLTVSRRSCNGMSSSTHGYSSAGAPTTNIIDKFQFAASANATDVGDLTVSQQKSGASSSTTNGYSADGGNSGGGSNHIEKISFSSDGNASDIGNLTNSGGNRAGTQH